MGYSGAWGKLFHEKPEAENLLALSLYTIAHYHIGSPKAEIVWAL
jgi:hypothetical protein